MDRRTGDIAVERDNTVEARRFVDLSGPADKFPEANMTGQLGMHKHFRMLAISDYMKSQGYATPTEQHTRIPGIWKKLGTLYNLSGLDDRVGTLQLT